MNRSYYRRQIKKLEDEIKSRDEISEKDLKHLKSEITNYERAIRQSEPAKPKGVDAYLV